MLSIMCQQAVLIFLLSPKSGEELKSIGKKLINSSGLLELPYNTIRYAKHKKENWEIFNNILSAEYERWPETCRC